MKLGNLFLYNDAVERLKSRHWYRYNSSATRESDQLLAFTLSETVAQDSETNFEYLREFARRHGAPYFIITDYGVQFVGHDHEIFKTEFITVRMIDDYHTYRENATDAYYYRDQSLSSIMNERNYQGDDTGLYASQFDSWRMGGCWVLPKRRGFYNTDTGEKIANRRQQIECLWKLGFMSRRGRPLTAASPSVSITRDEVNELLRLLHNIEQKHKSGKPHNEFTVTMYRLYRRVIRYCAWPGFW